MGFRFRKSVKAGPVRFNFSKSGVGCSVGTKGFRFTKKAGGGTRTTTSLPGTGISFVKDSKKEKRGSYMKNASAIEPITQHNPDSQNNHPDGIQSVTKKELLLAWLLGYWGIHKFYRKKYGMGILYLLTAGLFFMGWLGDAIWLTTQYISAKNGKPVKKGHKIGAYIAGVLCVFILGSCGRQNTTPVPTEPIATETAITETAAPTTIPTATSATEPEETAEPETTAVTTIPPETTVETEPATTAPTEPQVTYVLNTGTMKFHRPNCSSVEDIKESNKVPFTGTRDEAIARGYKACGRCHP